MGESKPNRTGDFFFEFAADKPDPDDERCVEGLPRLRLVNGLADRVGYAVRDNRCYELHATFPEPEPGGLPGREWFRLRFSLVLLDPLQAEVGEWVKSLPVSVPEVVEGVRVEEARLGEGFGQAEGRLFRRGRLGWQRVG